MTCMDCVLWLRDQLRPQRRLLLVGIDDASRAALFAELTGRPGLAAPATGINCACGVRRGMYLMTVYEAASYKAYQEVWPEYMHLVQGVVFVALPSSARDDEQLQGLQYVARQAAAIQTPVAVVGGDESVRAALTQASPAACSLRTFTERSEAIDWLLCGQQPCAGIPLMM